MTWFLTRNTPIRIGVSQKPSLTVCVAMISCSYILSSSTAGIAILSKIEPLSVTRTLPNHPDSCLVKGRLITLEFKNYYVIGTYVVNAGRGLKVTLLYNSFLRLPETRQTLNQKKEWNQHFENYIRDLDRKKPVIWTGDLNVAPTEKGSIQISGCRTSLIGARPF